MSNKLKADMNFLEYPTSVVAPRGEDKKIYELKITNEKYFRLVSRADQRLPNSKDKIILYYLLNELKKNNFESNNLIISKYQISKDIWGNVGKNLYKRIETALSRYKGVTAEFKGCFFEDGKYSSGQFSFINDWFIRKSDKKLEIKFNDYYIDQIRNTRFYRRIDFAEIKKLNSNTAIRLYEYLLKQKAVFKIGIIKLGKKLTLAEDQLYPSVIMQKLNRSMKELATKTSLKIKFNYNEERKVVTFYGMKPEDILELEEDNIKESWSNLSSNEQKGFLKEAEDEIIAELKREAVKQDKEYIPIKIFTQQKIQKAMDIYKTQQHK